MASEQAKEENGPERKDASRHTTARNATRRSQEERRAEEERQKDEEWATNGRDKDTKRQGSTRRTRTTAARKRPHGLGTTGEVFCDPFGDATAGICTAIRCDLSHSMTDAEEHRKASQRTTLCGRAASSSTATRRTTKTTIRDCSSSLRGQRAILCLRRLPNNKCVRCNDHGKCPCRDASPANKHGSTVRLGFRTPTPRTQSVGARHV